MADGTLPTFSRHYSYSNRLWEAINVCKKPWVTTKGGVRTFTHDSLVLCIAFLDLPGLSGLKLSECLGRDGGIVDLPLVQF